MIYRSVNIEWLGHAGFKIKSSKAVVYIDPFKIYSNLSDEEGLGFDDSPVSTGGIEKADFIFITHSHFDHCSIEDINKIAKDNTVIVCSADCQSKFRHINKKVIIKPLEGGNQLEFEEFGVRVWAVHSYNINKNFHTREEDWNGYVIQLDEVKVYHAGDTDLIPEMKNLNNMNIDFALLPIGGTYTMNAGEAAKAASVIKAKYSIPMHFGTVDRTGDKSEADVFLKNCGLFGVEGKVLEKIG
jgi:L-ascorbate metabolism protein UlaG (beta-lactamase superfamily)